MNLRIANIRLRLIVFNRLTPLAGIPLRYRIRRNREREIEVEYAGEAILDQDEQRGKCALHGRR
jgi:hypothetical protein